MAEESSFLGVIERLKAEGQLDRNSGSNSIKTLKQINVEGFNSLFNSMNELVDFFKGNALQDEENRREMLKALKGGKKEEKKEEKKTKSDGFKIPGLGGILGAVAAGITGLLAGFVVGLGQNFVSVLKFLGKSLNKALIKPILNFIKRTKTFRRLRASLFLLTKRIKNFVGIIRNFTKNGKLFTKLKSVLNGLVRIVRGFVGSVSSLVKSTRTFKLLRVNVKLFKKEFVKALKPVLNIFKAIPKAFGSISGLIGKVIPGGGGGLMKLFSPLKGFFGTFGKLLPKFFALGKVFGRLFLPFTVITSLIDFIKGAFGGFQKYKDKGFIEGLIGGLLGGISGLAQGLIGMPLDLLKSAVSWVAGKLGFENFSEILDSFSFKELIGGLYDKITDGVIAIVDFFKELFSNPKEALSGLATKVMDITKSILRFILPTPDSDAPWYDPRSLVAKAIPDSVYEYAGLDPKTGEIIPELEVTQVNNTGAQMEVGMSNIADSQSQPSTVVVSGGGGGAGQNTTVNAPSVTFNGSNHADESTVLSRPVTTMAYGF